jgi:hypothetical protein
MLAQNGFRIGWIPCCCAKGGGFSGTRKSGNFVVLLEGESIILGGSERVEATFGRGFPLRNKDVAM